MITDIAVYSDSLKPGVIQELPGKLKGIRYNNQAMGEKIEELYSDEEQEEEMFRDIERWLRNVEL